MRGCESLRQETTGEGLRALRVGTDEIRAYFDRVGPWFYAFFFRLMGYRASLKYLLRNNYRRLGLRQGTRILDAGIGTGFLTVNLLKEAPDPLLIFGLDFSMGMLVGLNRWLRELGLEERVKLHLADMRQIPFADETFELIMTSAAMEYLPDVNEGISECVRVLRPGGKFLFIATRNSFMGKVIAATWKNKVLDPDHVRGCMKKAGITRIDNLRFPRYFPHTNWWGMCLLGEKGADSGGRSPID
jgi:ubiquinone/menaquinone biosynthesis C-methylase UbiE